MSVTNGVATIAAKRDQSNTKSIYIYMELLFLFAAHVLQGFTAMSMLLQNNYC